MTGLILCGGQSTRMGTDKGMLQKDATTWAQLAFNKLSALSIPVVLSVNQQQQTVYSNYFDPSLLINDDTNLSIGGPLHGILSVHDQFPLSDLLVLACDMPFMEEPILQELLTLYQQNKNADAFVYTNAEELEPLCAIYTAKGLVYILQLYRDNKLPKHSMKYMLEHINTFTTPLSDEQKKYFRNINTHAELNGL